MSDRVKTFSPGDGHFDVLRKILLNLQDDQSSSVPVAEGGLGSIAGLTLNDHSGTIAVSNTPELAGGASGRARRAWVMLQNNSATQTLYVNVDGTHASTAPAKWFTLPPLGVLEFNAPGFVPTANIYVQGTAAQTFTLKALESAS